MQQVIEKVEKEVLKKVIQVRKNKKLHGLVHMHDVLSFLSS